MEVKVVKENGEYDIHHCEKVVDVKRGETEMSLKLKPNDEVLSVPQDGVVIYIMCKGHTVDTLRIK